MLRRMADYGINIMQDDKQITLAWRKNNGLIVNEKDDKVIMRKAIMSLNTLAELFTIVVVILTALGLQEQQQVRILPLSQTFTRNAIPSDAYACGSSYSTFSSSRVIGGQYYFKSHVGSFIGGNSSFGTITSAYRWFLDTINTPTTPFSPEWNLPMNLSLSYSISGWEPETLVSFSGSSNGGCFKVSAPLTWSTSMVDDHGETYNISISLNSDGSQSAHVYLCSTHVKMHAWSFSYPDVTEAPLGKVQLALEWLNDIYDSRASMSVTCKQDIVLNSDYLTSRQYFTDSVIIVLSYCLIGLTIASFVASVAFRLHGGEIVLGKIMPHRNYPDMDFNAAQNLSWHGFLILFRFFTYLNYSVNAAFRK